MPSQGQCNVAPPGSEQPADGSGQGTAGTDGAAMSLDSPLLSGGSPRATLKTVYDAISDSFVRCGVREGDVAHFRQLCRVDGEAALPLRYDKMTPPYPAASVRLAILPVAPTAEQCTSILEGVAAVLAALPRGEDFAVHRNEPQYWHVTVFHTARLGDARPDAMTVGGGVNSSLDGPAAQRPPSDEELSRELAAFCSQVTKFSPITLQVYRLVMADSGVLLLCCIDLSSQMAQMRGALKRAMAGAPAKQTATLHISLLRLAGGCAAFQDPEARARVQAVCDEWSAKLRGTTFVVNQVVHVLEEVFTTARGGRETAFQLPHTPLEEAIAEAVASVSAAEQ